MRLAAFIATNMDIIVDEFVRFARTLEPAALGESVAELSDHAREILLAIVQQLPRHETPKQIHEKSVRHVSETGLPDTAAAQHGAARQVSGYTLPQLTAEYRALRASVLGLWMPTIKTLSKATASDMSRFHEGIDQALQESAINFANKNNQTRDTFLAILGHDLRSPLATMTLAGALLTRTDEGTERTAQIGARVKRSAAAMTTMVNDLLEYARTELGGKIPVCPTLGDLHDICQSAVDEASAAHPDCEFELIDDGETIGDFDGPRLAQVFSNLLNNAAQYRSDQRPVTLEVKSDASGWDVTVTNFGREISSQAQRVIFDPLVQLSVSSDQKGPASTSFGLGLFIAREIAVAHGGSISVQSSEALGTVFTVRLPRVLATGIS
ncbi:HAMP domain-containing sensor histidine kinase [Actimicrobium antarcticum]|uniref:histidine kinase n=1 Tax=Actimicrobium antarcticum TaxID=1051899 RepID=A0ABP7SU92_9BURK